MFLKRKEIMKKLISIIFVILILCINLCGCSKEPTPPVVITNPELSVPPPDDKQEIVIATMFGLNSPLHDEFKTLLDGFSSQNDDIYITDISPDNPADLETMIDSGFSGVKTPDIIFYYTGSEAENKLSKVPPATLSDIKKYFPDYAGNIKTEILEISKRDSKEVSAVPVFGIAEALYVNTYLFEQNGVDIPTSWDTFITTISAFTEKEITPISVSLDQMPHYLIDNLVLSAGTADEHSKSLTKLDAIPESYLKGLSLVTELEQMGAFSGAGVSVESAITDFINGNSAMMVSNTMIEQLITSDQALPISFPSYTGVEQSQIVHFSSGYYISKNALSNKKKKDLVVALTSHLTSNEAIATMTENYGVPSVVLDESLVKNSLQKAKSDLLKADSFSTPFDLRLNENALTYLIAQIPPLSKGEVNAYDVWADTIKLNG